MSEASSTLNGLIDVAERTLCCRQRGTPADFDDFAREVSALQPPVGVTFSDAPRNLVALLMCFWQSPDVQRPLWMTAIAAILQLVRGDLSQIIEARRRPIEPDAAQYAGRQR